MSESWDGLVGAAPQGREDLTATQALPELPPGQDRASFGTFASAMEGKMATFGTASRFSVEPDALYGYVSSMSRTCDTNFDGGSSPLRGGHFETFGRTDPARLGGFASGVDLHSASSAFVDAMASQHGALRARYEQLHQNTKTVADMYNEVEQTNTSGLRNASEIAGTAEIGGHEDVCSGTTQVFTGTPRRARQPARNRRPTRTS